MQELRTSQLSPSEFLAWSNLTYSNGNWNKDWFLDLREIEYEFYRQNTLGLHQANLKKKKKSQSAFSGKLSK